jgi:hypothetical protein
MTYRIEVWSHQTGWHTAPGQEAHESREAAEEWARELTRPGRRPLRLPAEVRICPNN